jgi:hypothetical protein
MRDGDAGIEGTDEITTIRRTRRVFGMVVTSSVRSIFCPFNFFNCELHFRLDLSSLSTKLQVDWSEVVWLLRKSLRYVDVGRLGSRPHRFHAPVYMLL